MTSSKNIRSLVAFTYTEHTTRRTNNNQVEITVENVLDRYQEKMIDFLAFWEPILNRRDF